MKKILYFAIAAACGVSLVACEPQLIKGYDGDLVADPVTAEELAEGISFTQFSDPAFTTPAEDGNYIKFVSAAGIVQLYNIKSDGSENILATGASGSFSIVPKRGADPVQKIYGRFPNQDGTYTAWEGQLTVYVPSELAAELKILLGETGKKTWKWNLACGNCWGNGGNAGSGEAFTPGVVDGSWWGVATPEELLDQLQHAAGGVATGGEDSGAYMVFDEDGNIVSYKSDGTVIKASTFTLDDYTTDRHDGWELATLNTKDPAVLFPFSINEGGVVVNSFDVMYLDNDDMTLVYTKGNGAGSWAEITHWVFSGIDYQYWLYGDDRKWGWANDGVEVWGNAGNSGGGASFTANNVDGKWWGVVDPSELTGQLAHSDTGVATGEESLDAYMIFDKSGTVTCYDGSNNVIRSGAYTFEMYDERNEGWEIGKLVTSDVLFPFSINEGGVKAPEFDIMYMDGNNMTLVYTKGNGSGSWAEITYWRFASK